MKWGRVGAQTRVSRRGRYATGMYRILLLGRWVALVFAFVALLPAHAADAVSFKRVPVGKAVLSVPANWTTHGNEVPVWIHLHGAIEVVEREFASVGAPGVLVTLTLPGLSRV